jgi:hypothetical protein
MWELTALPLELLAPAFVNSHISPKEGEITPNFLHAALDTSACAPFIKERRMKIPEPTTFHRKFGDMGHPRSC